MSRDDRHVEESRQPFLEHLRELRSRLQYSLVAMILGISVAWFYRIEIFDWLMEPYVTAAHKQHIPNPDQLGYRGLAEAFLVYFKASAAVGALAAGPFALLQGWLFVAPGLYRRERKLAIPFLVFTVLCFYSGVLFARYTLLPVAVDMMLQFGGPHALPTIMMEEYFSFAAASLLVMGLVFETPVLISFLALLGIVNDRMLLRHWRYAVVGSVIAGAVFPSPDVLSQLFIAVPLILLYFLSALLARLIQRAGSKPVVEEAA
jgi:sec-independent protein translocase protein TatC